MLAAVIATIREQKRRPILGLRDRLPGWLRSRFRRWLRAALVGSSPRLGVCGIACVLRNSSGGGKDDHASGADGVHGGYGVGGARRVGVGVPAGRQRDRTRHAGRGDWALRRGVNLPSRKSSLLTPSRSFLADRSMDTPHYNVHNP